MARILRLSRLVQVLLLGHFAQQGLVVAHDCTSQPVALPQDQCAFQQATMPRGCKRKCRCCETLIRSDSPAARRRQTSQQFRKTQSFEATAAKDTLCRRS